MKIVVIDGQGGKLGSAVVAKLKKEYPENEIYAVGTNSIAVAAMLKAGADHGASGENPVIVNCRDADIIIGPIGIVLADAMLGEITPKMAQAIGSCSARKILIPNNKCKAYVVGTEELTLAEYVDMAIKRVKFNMQ